MEAELNKTGKIEITPDSKTEEYALKIWKKKNKHRNIKVNKYSEPKENRIGF